METENSKIEIHLKAKRTKESEGNGKRYTVMVETKSQSPIIKRKWAAGKQPAAYFADNGNEFRGAVFDVQPGLYSVYAENSDGEKTVQAIRIRKNRLPLYFALLLLLIGVGIGSIFLAQHKPSSPTANPKKPDNISSASAINTAQKKQTVTVKDEISGAAVFQSGNVGDSGKWHIRNKSTLILQTEIYLDNQVIAETPAMQPGEQVNSIQLKKSLAPGTYKGYAYSNYYDPKTRDYVNTSPRLVYGISLIVQ